MAPRKEGQRDPDTVGGCPSKLLTAASWAIVSTPTYDPPDILVTFFRIPRLFGAFVTVLAKYSSRANKLASVTPNIFKESRRS